MVDNPIQTLAGSGSTIRAPDQLREVNEGAIFANAAADTLAISTEAVKNINEYVVLSDATEAVETFLTEEDQTILNDAGTIAKTIRASSSNSISGKATATLRLDSAFKSMAARNPHLARKLEGIKNPAEKSRRYMLGKAVNEGVAAGYKEDVKNATTYAMIHGNSNLPIEEQLKLYANKKLLDENYQTETKALTLSAAQTTNKENKQELVVTSLVNDFTNNNRQVREQFGILLSVSRERGLEIMKGNPAFKGLLPSFEKTTDDKSFSNRIRNVYLGTLQQSKINLLDKVNSTEGIVNRSNATADIKPALDVLDLEINKLSGEDALKHIQAGLSLEDINIASHWAGKNPEIYKLLSLIRGMKLEPLFTKTASGIGVANQLSTIISKTLNDISTGKVPEEDVNPAKPNKPGQHKVNTKTLLTALVSQVNNPKTPIDLKNTGVKTAIAIGNTIAENSKKLADEGLQTSYHTSFFKIMDDPEHLKQFMKSENAAQVGSTVVMQFFDNVYKNSFSKVMGQDLPSTIDPTVTIPDHIAMGTSFGDSDKIEVASLKTGYAGITYQTSPSGQLTFIVDSKQTESMNSDEIRGLEDILKVINKKADQLHSAIKLGAASVNGNPQAFARGIASHILTVRPPSVNLTKGITKKER